MFAFKGQNTKLSVNILLTCIIYYDAGPGCDKNCLQAVGTSLSQKSYYLSSNGFLRRCCSFTSRKLYVSLDTNFMDCWSSWTVGIIVPG